jgi:hypothetical protein
MSPATIVELGTQYGESYFTFCQAIAERGIACKAFAVDTWRGDSNTGAYGESVFREVSAHNRQHYGGFSTLLRTLFDEAAERFPNDSIDLLHIDGLHTYEAVHHDFETWFPRVRPGGIALLHDTQIRRREFGVWRLWEELRERYESFEFPHSCGLGVIQKPGGKGVRTGVAAQLFRDAEQAEAVRRFYRLCGERLEYKDRLERQARAGEWDLLAKLFWRADGEMFSEERSVHARAAVTAVASEICLEAPGNESLAQLRIDLLESPAFMRIHAIRLTGRDDEILWASTKEFFETPVCSGLRLTAEDNGSCLGARLSGEPPSILLNIPRVALSRFVPAGSLRLELSGLDPAEYAEALDSMRRNAVDRAEAAESNLGALKSEVQRHRAEASARDHDLREARNSLAASQTEAIALSRGLAEAQDLARRYEAEARTLDRALGEAQRGVEASQAEAVALSRGLAEAQDLARRYEAEAGTLDRALSETQLGLAASQTEAVALSRGLAQAEDLARRYQAESVALGAALSEAQGLAVRSDAARQDVERRHREAIESLDRAERAREEQEARIVNLKHTLEQTCRELAAREEQLCASAADLNEARRHATNLEREVLHTSDEAQRSSASLREWEGLYAECSRRLREIESSLTWKMTRALRSLPGSRGR